jgi:hypothetical protein
MHRIDDILHVDRFPVIIAPFVPVLEVIFGAGVGDRLRLGAALIRSFKERLH